MDKVSFAPKQMIFASSSGELLMKEMPDDDVIFECEDDHEHGQNLHVVKKKKKKKKKKRK